MLGLAFFLPTLLLTSLLSSPLSSLSLPLTRSIAHPPTNISLPNVSGWPPVPYPFTIHILPIPLTVTVMSYGHYATRLFGSRLRTLFYSLKDQLAEHNPITEKTVDPEVWVTADKVRAGFRSLGNGISHVEAFFILDVFYNLMSRYGFKEILAAIVQDGEGVTVG